MSLWDSILRLIDGRWFGWSWDLPTFYTNPTRGMWMPPNAKYPTPKDFLKAIQPAAMEIERRLGIPWLYTATQAAHESRYGNSGLAVNACNLFGVTGDDTLTNAGASPTLDMESVKSWLSEHPEVPVLIMKTKEESPYPPEKIRYWTRPGDVIEKTKNGGGSDLLVERPFRRYESYEDCLTAWAALIMRKYPDAYDAATRQNFNQFAQALQAGGYATDGAYSTSLVQLHAELEAMA